MTAGLGNYVHHHAKGYQKYGINKPETLTSGVSFGAAVGEAHAKINEYMQIARVNSHQIDVKTLEDLFTYMQGGTPRNGAEINKRLQKYLESHGENVKEAFKRLHPGAIITDGLDVKTSYTKGMSSFEMGESRIKKSSLSKVNSNITKMLSRLKSSQSVVRRAAGFTKEEVKLIIGQLKESQNIIQEALDSLKEKSDDSSYALGSGSGSVRTAIEDMNRIMDTYFEDPKNLKGQLLEMYFGALQVVGSKVFQQSEATLIKAMNVKGQNTSRSGFFNIDVAIQGLLTEELNNSSQKKNNNNTSQQSETNKFILQNGTIIQQKQSQTTVDVTIDVTNLAETVKKVLQLEQDLNISAKNYSYYFANKSGFTIIGNTNLLSTLQLIGTNFGNHLLNLLGNSLSVPSEAIDVIKVTLAIRGLLGIKAEDTGINTANIANVFATNINNGVNGIKFMTTYDLMTNIYRNMGLITMTDLPSSLLNDYVGKAPDWGDANIRIARLLVVAHATKLTAHLSMSAMGY